MTKQARKPISAAEAAARMEQTIAAMSVSTLKTCIEVLAKSVAQNPSDADARLVLTKMAQALARRQGVE